MVNKPATIAGEPRVIGLSLRTRVAAKASILERDLNGTLMGGNDLFVIRQ